MSKKELIIRYVLFIISLFFSAFGIAFVRCAGLGVSPISSISNVLSIRFPSVSLGSWLVLFNVALIIGQILILRRKFELYQLIQLPLSFPFGYFTDLGMEVASQIALSSYFSQLLMLFLGIFILAFGIALSVIANVVMNSGEAFVKAIADTAHFSFGNVKIGFDISCFVISLIMSLFFFNFRIIGIREGTIISAFLTGMVVKVYLRYLKRPIENMVRKIGEI